MIWLMLHHKEFLDFYDELNSVEHYNEVIVYEETWHTQSALLHEVSLTSRVTTIPVRGQAINIARNWLEEGFSENTIEVE